jgi:hypothetical protein
MGIQEIYSVLGGRSRRKRLDLLMPLLIRGADTTLIDVGGTPEFWLRAGHLAHVTIVNIARPASADRLPSWMEFRLASGTALPFVDDSFDVAFSNSAIEHLGSGAAQRAFAEEIARVGRSCFVQTPCKAFPVEPHYLTPFVHWLPAGMRRRLARRFTVWAWITHPTQEYVDRMVAEIRLLSKKELSALFPDAGIVVERFWGFPKSLVAIKPAH